MISSLLIRNGSLLNAETGTTSHADISIRDGIVEAVGPQLRRDSQAVVDADGLILVPGLVDTHAHLYHDSACLGVDPEQYHLPKGVTYAIDQGSAGADNYEDFRMQAVFRTGLRCKSFLNCSRIGMPLESLTGAGELTDITALDRDAFVDCYHRYRDELLGLKIRLTPNICPGDPLEALDKALAIAEELSIPIVIHPNQAATTTEELVTRLRPGDVYTHTYNNSHTGIVAEDGRIKQCVREARERGVIFDTGHGATSMSFPVLVKALEVGFLPDTISTDLHNANVDGPVYDMATTLSKFLCLGVPMAEVFRRALHTPVRLFGLEDKAVTIAEGMTADIAAFALSEGEYVYLDAEKNTLPGRYRLTARFTVLGDRLFTER